MRSWRPCLMILLCCVATIGCSRPPMVVPTMFQAGQVDAFWDLEDGEKSDTYKIFYATDRKSDDGGHNWQSYGKTRSDLLDLGTAMVRFGEKDEDTWSDLYGLTSGRPGGDRPGVNVGDTFRYGELYTTQFVVDEETGLPRRVSTINDASERFISELAAAVEASHGKEITIYIHGFKNGFQEALKTTAEYDHYTGDLGPFICYSWPSYNSVWEYSHDRDSVRYTAAHCRDLLEFLEANIRSGRLNPKRINFLCHSSGAEVVGTVLREIALRSDELSPEQRKAKWRVGAVLMVSPDVSTDVARERVLKEDLAGMFEKVVVYSSRHDRALHWASRFLYRTARLGSISEKDLSDADRFWLSIYPQVMIINVDNQPNNDFVGHSHHRFSPATASDIILNLRGDLPPRDRGLVRGEDEVIWRFAEDYPQKVLEAAKKLYPLRGE